MKSRLAVALVFTNALLIPSANAANDSGTATATVIAPITIVATVDLTFGRFAAETGGTVIISAAGARSTTGAIFIPAAGGTPSAAEFDVTGDTGATYSITLPDDVTVTIDDAGAGDPMAVTTFTSSPLGTSTLTTGAETVNVGATLAVSSGQLAGDYTGTFTVMVEYN